MEPRCKSRPLADPERIGQGTFFVPKSENLPVRTEPDIQAILKQITQEEIQRDFDYYMAQRVAEQLKNARLISIDEFNKLTAINRRTFLPMNVEILPKIR